MKEQTQLNTFYFVTHNLRLGMVRGKIFISSQDLQNYLLKAGVTGDMIYRFNSAANYRTKKIVSINLNDQIIKDLSYCRYIDNKSVTSDFNFCPIEKTECDLSGHKQITSSHLVDYDEQKLAKRNKKSLHKRSKQKTNSKKLSKTNSSQQNSNDKLKIPGFFLNPTPPKIPSTSRQNKNRIKEDYFVVFQLNLINFQKSLEPSKYRNMSIPYELTCFILKNQQVIRILSRTKLAAWLKAITAINNELILERNLLTVYLKYFESKICRHDDVQLNTVIFHAYYITTYIQFFLHLQMTNERYLRYKLYYQKKYPHYPILTLDDFKSRVINQHAINQFCTEIITDLDFRTQPYPDEYFSVYIYEKTNLLVDSKKNEENFIFFSELIKQFKQVSECLQRGTLAGYISVESLLLDSCDIEHPFALKAPPTFTLCNLTNKLMRDPVVAPSGKSYDRIPIEKHIAKYGIEPGKAGKKIKKSDLYPNRVLLDFINHFNKNSEFEPTLFYCSIKKALPNSPVITPSGNTYDFFHLKKWIELSNTEPQSRADVHLHQIRKNMAVKRAIKYYRRHIRTHTDDLKTEKNISTRFDS